MATCVSSFLPLYYSYLQENIEVWTLHKVLLTFRPFRYCPFSAANFVHFLCPAPQIHFYELTFVLICLSSQKVNLLESPGLEWTEEMLTMLLLCVMLIKDIIRMRRLNSHFICLIYMYRRCLYLMSMRGGDILTYLFILSDIVFLLKYNWCIINR